MRDLEIILAVQRIDRWLDEEKTSEIGLREQVKGMMSLMMDVRLNVRKIAHSRGQDRLDMIATIYKVACQVENIIDTHSLRKYKREMATKRYFGVLSCLSSLLDDPNGSRIKSEISELRDKLKGNADYMNNAIRIGPKYVVGSSHAEWRGLNTDEDSVVGLHQVKDQLIQHLLEKLDNLRAITLCGLGGVGKSTLARQVYYDRRIQREFSFRIWIGVYSKFETKDILLKILQQLGVKYIDVENLEIAKLVDRVVDCLRKKERYLVVLDDVWSTQDMDELYSFFPDNQKGSRILLTTRKAQVAEYGNPKPIVYRVVPLREEEAWELLTKTIQLYRGPEYELEEYKEKMGMELVKRCEGLPLAIIGLGKKLAAIESSREWDLVYQNATTLIPDETVLQVLAPSCDNLPDHLKLCFFYLGNLPEDSMMDVDKLYHFWIVEGLVKQQNARVGETLLNVAERYLTELAGMSMVEVDEEESPRTTRLKSCRIHTAMRQICISKSDEIDFSHTASSWRDSDSTSYSWINKSPRSLFVYVERPEDLSRILDSEALTENLRILQLLDSYQHQNREPVRLSVKFKGEELRLLRVLDFHRIDFRQNDLAGEGRGISGLLEWISKLVNLRYLSFKGCFLGQLPALTISNLLYLQVLDLRVDDSITEITLPNVLWKLRMMKHLYLPRMFRTYDGEKLRLDGLTELLILDNFITAACNVNDLCTFTKLLNLDVKIDGSLPDLQFITEHVKQPSKKQIRLSIDLRNFDCYVQKRHSLLIQVLQSQAVRIFCIEGHIRELPPNYKISPSLIKIVLSRSELQKDPLETLAMLPNLRVLILRDDAFVGTDMITPPSGFPELKRLELLNLQFLEKWMVANDSMPKLSNTKIVNCKKLSKLDCFEFITTLSKLETREMSESFERWLHHTNKRQQKNVTITFSAIHGEPLYIPESELDLARSEITRSIDEPSSSGVKAA